MQTKKDLYQAHRLMQQRLGMALLQAEPDVPESPMRRQNVATFGGILVGVLVMAVFGIWGLVKPGNATKLTDPGQLLVEEETGATFVYSQQQQRLLPVANYVSARLVLDAGEITTRSVTAASLAGLSRGPLIGIPGAPDSLPVREKLVKAPWSVCVVDVPDNLTGRRPYTTLVGGTDVGGKPVGTSAMVVSDGQQNWVIWGDRRMRVGEPGVRALNAQPRKVPTAWLTALPVGRDFKGPDVANRGKKLRAGGQATAVVGQVFTVPALPGTAARWYVLLDDGLAPITAVQARLLLEDPASKKAYGNRPVQPIQIDAASANAAPSRQNVMDTSLPPAMPNVINVPGSAPLCSVYANTAAGSVAAKVTVGSRITIPTPANSSVQNRFDQVLLPPGSAVVAGVLPGEGQLNAVAGALSLITDQGVRFPVPSADVLTKLGYDAADIAPVPASIMQSIPQGPTLDLAAAMVPVTVAGR
ncbi:type VII secretion protein EccB [Nonomuraea polychroma]|uniref:Type VII secretion protein EccB n=1 Tax=Nonomuraea polychroma TaxID=46176 RepID=A0A438MPU1_9ACTN|nr:type VII secretion protein EccB [Nonomuraea polychroma]RVX47356.1 type VII secretion protein EccB [Nonomuraea polychroma]